MSRNRSGFIAEFQISETFHKHMANSKITFPMTTNTFAERKGKILSQLAIPDQEYTDLSPKGSVDEGIRKFVDEINLLDGFVTTSSCAGRVAVFLDGASKKAEPALDNDADVPSSAAAQGGKGGGQWLYVSHDPVDMSGLEQDGQLLKLFGMESRDTISIPPSDYRPQFVHFRFEPMVCSLNFLLKHISFVLFAVYSPLILNSLETITGKSVPSKHIVAIHNADLGPVDSPHPDLFLTKCSACTHSSHVSWLPRIRHPQYPRERTKSHSSNPHHGSCIFQHHCIRHSIWTNQTYGSRDVPSHSCSDRK